jgi:DNA topoisomerase-1
MRLVISEKNIAAKRIAEILAVGKPKADKVYTTPVYRFRGADQQDWVSIGLKGHIMAVDFPEGFSKWSLEDLTELVQADVLKEPAERGIIRSVAKLAKEADDVIVATDFDREGELIGADVRDIVVKANPKVPVSRVRFSAITKGEIERAFSDPGVISEDLAQAGEARQDIDLVWGAVLTRYLTLANQLITRRPYGDVLSAGRVQTPTLKLIVDRERERQAFDPVTYWTVRAALRKGAEGGTEFGAGHATDRFTTEEAARAAMEAVASATVGTVGEVKKTKRSQAAPIPFNTTSLMAAAANEGMTPAQTMRVAESLYMDGLMSYPRVDNTVYPESLDLSAILKQLSAVPAYREYAGRLLASGKLTPTRGSKETTDHPPIHPTGAADSDRLDGQALKLYNLVARRFMATLSGPAIIEGTRVDVDVAGQPFVAKGDVTIKAGFRGIYPYGVKKDDELPALTEGETVDFLGAQMEEKQTQPPSRYSQGRLIQEMEKLGLGTKSTRHDIIQGLLDRKYVVNDPLEPTCKGITVVEALSKYAGRITSPDMTKELEEEMDAIARAADSRVRVVGHSRNLLAEVMNALVPIAREVGETLKTATDEDARVGVCPKSGHDLLIKFSPKTRSSFVGCSGYPDCDVTYPLPKNAKFAAVEDMCEVCGSPQVKVIQFKKRPRVMCLSPSCPTKQGPAIMVRKGGCRVCGGDLEVVYSQVGNRYVRCSNYPECKTTYPLPQSGDIEPTDENCEPCGSPKIIVHTKKGPWKICIDPECPLRVAANGNGKYGRGARAGAAKKATTGKSAAVKKTIAAKKTTAKKTVAKKTATRTSTPRTRAKSTTVEEAEA